MPRINSVTFNGLPCIDPLELREHCLEADPPLPLGPWWGKANSFRCPLGPEPGRGWLLMRKEVVDTLVDALPGFWDAVFDDGEKKVTIKSLSIIRTQCAAPGWIGDKDAPHLVELVDARHYLQWKMIDAGYNLREYPGTAYLAPTLNSAVAWTWAEMAAAVWATALPALPFPGLPFVPDPSPDGFAFWAQSAWAAFNHITTRLACAVRFDPTVAIANAYSVIQLGATLSGANAGKLAALQKVRIFDGYPMQPEQTNWPASVVVRFRTNPHPVDGTSEFHTVTVADTADTSKRTAGTVAIIEDDLAYSGSNGAACATRAAERAADYFRKLTLFNKRALQAFAGARTEVFDLLGEQYVEAAVLDLGTGMRSELVALPDNWLEQWRAWRPEAEGVGSGGSGGSAGGTSRHADALVRHPLKLYPMQNTYFGFVNDIADGGYFAVPFGVGQSCNIDRLGISMDTGGALGLKIRLGIYESLGVSNLYPGALVLDAGELIIASDNPSSYGLEELSVSQTLDDPTMTYWAVIRIDQDALATNLMCAGIGSVAVEPGFPMGYGLTPVGTPITGVDYQISVNYPGIGYRLEGQGAIAALPDPFTGGAERIDYLGSVAAGFAWLVQAPLLWVRMSA